MALKNLCQASLLSLGLLGMFPAQAENGLGQTIEISTNLHSIVGNPSWLLIVRNEDTGEVIPYVYDFKNYDNYWIALTYARSYRITASELQFPYKTIHDFCHLRDGRLDNESYVITITGDLTPGRQAFRCSSMKFKNYSAPIAQPNIAN